MRLVRWPAEGTLPDAQIEALRQARCVVHVDPADVSFGALAALGVPVRPAGDEIPTDTDFLVVPNSRSTVAGAPESQRNAAMERLVAVVDRLLGPGGCPWDQEQTHESLKRHLLEEAYEVLDAIDSGSQEKLVEELGDLLLQPIMHAQMAALAGTFDLAAVADSITDKLVRRHPHVFGTLAAADSDAVLANWDRIKAAERGKVDDSILDGVPSGSASLLRAYEISRKAAKSGFEWPDLASVFEKLHEEEGELREAIASGNLERIESEVGDLLFTVVNVARWAGVEPETALRKMVNRFLRRFQAMERAAGAPLSELSPEAWDALWEAAKAETR